MKWKEEIDAKVLLPNGSPLPVVLLGNKCDLDEAEIDKAQLDKFCEEKRFCGWFDTSAKLNINIDKACRFLVEKILEHQDIFHKKKIVQVNERIFFDMITILSINNFIIFFLLILIFSYEY